MNTTSSFGSVESVKSVSLIHHSGVFSQAFAKELFQQLLQLGVGWDVDEIDYQPVAQTLEISVCGSEALWLGETCSSCSSQEMKFHDRTAKRSWRHIDVFTRKAVLVCAIPRGICQQCGAISKVKPGWLGKSKHFTKEFEALALVLMKEMAVKNVGKLLGETEQKLWRILYAYVEDARSELSRAAISTLKQQWNKNGI